MVLTLTKVSQRPTVKPTWGELNAFAMDTRWKTTKSSVTSRTVRECVGVKKQNERKAEEKSFEGGEGGPSFRLELPINHHSRQHLSPSSIPASTQLLSSFVNDFRHVQPVSSLIQSQFALKINIALELPFESPFTNATRYLNDSDANADNLLSLTESCTKKCIPNDYREGDLNKGESVCLDRCVSKFFEVNIKVSEKMQGEAANKQGGGMGFGM
ncbi:unnamed protein product [Aspergillus oryzae]|nr:unnamed protein product [Aspergillus oryzae]